jgi:hypothetical protein
MSLGHLTQGVRVTFTRREVCRFARLLPGFTKTESCASDNVCSDSCEISISTGSEPAVETGQKAGERPQYPSSPGVMSTPVCLETLRIVPAAGGVDRRVFQVFQPSFVIGPQRQEVLRDGFQIGGAALGLSRRLTKRLKGQR